MKVEELSAHNSARYDEWRSVGLSESAALDEVAHADLDAQLGEALRGLGIPDDRLQSAVRGRDGAGGQHPNLFDSAVEAFRDLGMGEAAAQTAVAGRDVTVSEARDDWAQASKDRYTSEQRSDNEVMSEAVQTCRRFYGYADDAQAQAHVERFIEMHPKADDAERRALLISYAGMLPDVRERSAA